MRKIRLESPFGGGGGGGGGGEKQFLKVVKILAGN